MDCSNLLTELIKPDGRMAGLKVKGLSAHPKELTYPCCLPTLGELGEISPRGEPCVDSTWPFVTTVIGRTPLRLLHDS